MNYLMIAGHLGADPETRFTSGGQKVTTLRVAVNSRRSGKDETSWYRVTIWGDQFEKMMPYLKKGSGIIVHGELHKPEIYNGRDGQPQISLNMTAHSLSFSPFGKGGMQSQTDGGGFSQGAAQPQQGHRPAQAPRAPQQKEMPAFGSGGFDQGANNSGFSGNMFGQGQAESTQSFSDEEIPF